MTELKSKAILRKYYEARREEIRDETKKYPPNGDGAEFKEFISGFKEISEIVNSANEPEKLFGSKK